MSVIDDIQQNIDDINSNLQDISDQIAQDESDNQDYTTQNDQNIQDLQNSSGQLTFPLSSDTTDLLNQQLPTMLQYISSQGYIGTATLVAGTVTIASNLITANSLILISRGSASGTVGILRQTTTAGQIIISSSSATDTSQVIYFILTS